MNKQRYIKPTLETSEMEIGSIMVSSGGSLEANGNATLKLVDEVTGEKVYFDPSKQQVLAKPHKIE